MTLQTQIIVLVAFILFSFTGGWQVCTWHMKSKELAAVNEAIIEHNKKEAEVVKTITGPLEKKLAALRKTNVLLQRSHKHAPDTACKLDPDDILLLKRKLPVADSP